MDDRVVLAITFLSIIFADKADTDYIVIWCKWPKTNRTFCFREIEEAARCGVEQADNGADVYVGICPIYLDLTGQPRRGTKQQTVGTPGLWSDLDVTNERHKRGNLFPTIDAARTFLDEVGFPPTLLIGSGGGLQSYILTERFKRFGKDDPWEKYDELSQAFNKKLALEAHARYNAWVDSTGDIARVFRLPGTINQGYEHKPVVSILEHNPGNLMRWEDMQRYVNMASAHIQARQGKLGGGSGVSTPSQEAISQERVAGDYPRTDPPPNELPDSVQRLIDLEPTFRAVFERQPGILKNKASDSEFDLSIASRAGAAGISDADIGAAIRWSRQHHAINPEKANKGWRQDYVERTVEKVHSGEGAETEDETREEILANLSIMLGIKVLDIVKYPGEPPSIQLVTDAGTVGMVTPEKLTWRGLNDRIYGKLNKDIRPMKPDDFTSVRAMIGVAMRVAPVGPLGSDIEEMRGKVNEYMGEARKVDHEDAPEPWKTNSSPKKLIYEGESWMRLEDFESWLFHGSPQMKQPTRQEWGKVLVGLGLTYKQIPMVNGDGKARRQGFWLVKMAED